MKPIGGIITSKKSIPDNFRQVETFTTEYLSKLWKIYTINRDVLDKGRRLENLFWRIWGSERMNRNFSGQKVSQIFTMIFESESGFELSRPPPRPIRAALPPPSSPSFVADIDTLNSPRPSLEIECPPTPPPSPVPPVTSVVGFQLGTSYLSKLPSQTAITASLRKKFPDAPPSPPIPSRSPVIVSTPIPPIEEVEDTVSPQLPPPLPSKSNLTVTIVANVQVSPGGAASYTTVASASDSSEGPKVSKARKTKSDRPPPRGRRKIVATKVTTTKATTGRTTVASKKNMLRPALPKRKSSSSSNTAVNTAVSSPSNTLTVDVARSLPSSSQQRQERKRNSSTEGDDEESRRKGDAVGSGWVVDPDFRTKYLEQKNKEKLGTLTKAVSTIAVSEAVTKASRRGKGKNVLVVDEIVSLKGLSEDMGDVQVAPIVSVRDVEVDEQTSNLPRRKSELTLLFEGAKKAGEKNGRERSTKKVQVIIEGEIRR
ncbi:uncharacterized protein H6S33_006340 [Morchella sextelata]|uniref:uncharacterized protein n=1 Tax=Morchella sextelata TaxID=1174677 RepID=UPI001D044106|nr:uncharacterized protein H6S33_006340 [Morchella sextelata]KAH0604672.1 hypothetical protein H6S33_006340 [Morchella sextelata]